MSAVPFIPDSAPFTPEQRAWLNGFFAGIFSRGPATATAPAQSAPALMPLTIVFGSQTGTAEGLAKKVAKEAGKRGFAATVVDAAQMDLAKLGAERNVLVITSTYGDGEPPDNAKALHAALSAASGATLSSLQFSVCGLGDTNYTHFNQCAKDFDTLLEKLGAKRVSPCVECDLDYEEKFNSWLSAALAALANAGSEFRVSSSESAQPKTQNSKPETDSALETRNPEPETHSSYSRSNPFPALLLTSRNLNAPGSGKQVHHVEFDLTGSGLVYEAGDALGVFAHNCPEHVQDVLTALGWDGEEAVPAPDGSSIPLRRALTEFYDLGKPTAELLTLVGACLQAIPASTDIASKLAPTSGHAQPHHVIDVLLQSKIEILKSKIPAPAEFVRVLKKLQPRLYSISSSPKAHAGQVHLTVGAVRYDKDGRARKGVCSTFLADRAQAGTTRIGVYIHSNKAFRPPANGDTPVIMVGPGTGIAPFRGFLHERRATGAKGKNWLFFGDQRAATDFLYQDELSALVKEGALTRLDTAFSRDQAEKIYVQQRMIENAAELYAWLEAGAHFYVCGDASRMAKDVDAALHRVVELAGKKSAEEAANYVQSLKTAKRYQRDVY
jgi:sulfite reductase (NADPH) flavoprotein alpha-component